MSKRTLFSAGLILLLAVTLTALRVPVASSQCATLTAAEVAGDLPLADPNAALWQQATAVEVPLSAQTIAPPMVAQARVRSVTASALHNGRQLALLVEWEDDTRDEQMVRVQDFRDAVAVQFSLAEGQPFFCMGQADGNVNIWHWKADWQADLIARQDQQTTYPNMYVDLFPFADPAAGLAAGPATYLDAIYLPALAAGNLFASAARASPVEDLVAGGYGTLTSQPAAGQNVQGYGVWTDGRWRVIFSRDLVSAEPDDVRLKAGKLYALAFAAWDGANGERNGQKSTSQWLALQLAGKVPAPPAPAAAPQMDVLGLAFVFGPMLLVTGGILSLAAGVLLLSYLTRRR